MVGRAGVLATENAEVGGQVGVRRSGACRTVTCPVSCLFDGTVAIAAWLSSGNAYTRVGGATGGGWPLGGWPFFLKGTEEGMAGEIHAGGLGVSYRGRE